MSPVTTRALHPEPGATACVPGGHSRARKPATGAVATESVGSFDDLLQAIRATRFWQFSSRSSTSCLNASNGTSDIHERLALAGGLRVSDRAVAQQEAGAGSLEAARPASVTARRLARRRTAPAWHFPNSTGT